MLPGLARAGSEVNEAALREAREQFAQGRKLEDQERWSEALPLFQHVGAVKMTPQVRFHIALCMENTGKLATALEGFRAAAREAKANAPNVVLEANAHIEEIAPRVPSLSVVVPQAAPGDVVMFDERPIAQADTISADPGPHTVEVRRGERVMAKRSVTLEERKSLRVELALLPQADGVPGLDQARGAGPDGRDASHRTAEPGRTSMEHGRTQRIVGWTALGLGAASIMGMGAFLALRADALSDLEALCPGLTHCSHAVEPIVSNGKTYAAMVNVFAGVGGAAIVGGALLLVMAPTTPMRNAGADRALLVAPVVGPHGTFLTVEGRF